MSLEVKSNLMRFFFWLLQVILPLGDVPDRRAGRNPKEDTEAFPPGGPCLTGVTGEAVCIRQSPDLQAVRRSASALSVYPVHISSNAEPLVLG